MYCLAPKSYLSINLRFKPVKHLKMTVWTPVLWKMNIHTNDKKLARNGRNTVIYKGTFVSNHSLAVVHSFRLDVVLSTHIPVFIFLFHSLNYLDAIGFIIERIQYTKCNIFLFEKNHKGSIKKGLKTLIMKADYLNSQNFFLYHLSYEFMSNFCG